MQPEAPFLSARVFIVIRYELMQAKKVPVDPVDTDVYRRHRVLLGANA